MVRIVIIMTVKKINNEELCYNFIFFLVPFFS